MIYEIWGRKEINKGEYEYLDSFNDYLQRYYMVDKYRGKYEEIIVVNKVENNVVMYVENDLTSSIPKRKQRKFFIDSKQ